MKFLNKPIFVAMLSVISLIGCASPSSTTSQLDAVQNVKALVSAEISAPLAHLPKQLKEITRDNLAENARGQVFEL